MLEATFTFGFRNGNSFCFQDSSTLQSTKANQKLTICFPNGDRLIYSSQTSVLPDPIPVGEGNLGDENSYILADLRELGFDTFNPLVYVDIDNLKKDIALNPSMYVDSFQNPIGFDEPVFPSGVYKIEYSFSIVEIIPNPIPDPMDNPTTDPAPAYYGEQYVINIFRINNWIAIEAYPFLYNITLEGIPHNIARQIEVLLLKEAGIIQFECYNYTNANKLLMAADNLCIL